MKRLIYGILLVTASCVLMAGSASRPAVALESNPVLLADCAFPAADCCSAVCKGLISGCCVNNACGLPVVPMVIAKSSGGLAASCSALPPPEAPAPKPQSPRPPASGVRPNS